MARHSSATRRSSVPKVRTSKYFSYFENGKMKRFDCFPQIIRWPETRRCAWSRSGTDRRTSKTRALCWSKIWTSSKTLYPKCASTRRTAYCWSWPLQVYFFYDSSSSLLFTRESRTTRVSVDILSYAAMKLSGFPPHRVVGLGTFLDSCRFQYFIAQKLGISASSVQASVICENGPTSGKWKPSVYSLREIYGKFTK